MTEVFISAIYASSSYSSYKISSIILSDGCVVSSFISFLFKSLSSILPSWSLLLSFPVPGMFLLTPLRIWLLRGWGRYLKVTLQTRAPENFRSRRWGAEQRVLRAQTWERGPPSVWAEFQDFATDLWKTGHQAIIMKIAYSSFMIILIGHRPG